MTYLENFQKPKWLKTVENSFGNGDRKFFVHEICDDEEHPVKLPLVQENHDIPNVGIVNVCRYGPVFFSDYLVIPETGIINKDSISSLISGLESRHVDVLWLSNIPENSDLYKALVDYSELTKAGNFIECVPTLGVKCADNYEKYLSQLTHNMRRNVRRKVSTIEERDSSYNIELTTTEKLKILLTNQRDRAIMTGNSILAEDKEFNNAVMELESNPDVKISEVKVDGDIASQLLLLFDRDQIGVFIQSFNQKFASLSPSFCNFVYLIRCAHKEGFNYVDLLRGDELYKRHFANNVIELTKFIAILNPNLDSEPVMRYIEEYEE